MRSLNQRTSSSAFRSFTRTFLLGRCEAISQSCCILTKGIDPSANGVAQRRLALARLFCDVAAMLRILLYHPRLWLNYKLFILTIRALKSNPGSASQSNRELVTAFDLPSNDLFTGDAWQR